MEDHGLPGLRAHYEFVSAGEAVELRLGLRFDPTETKLTQEIRRLWLEFRDRLTGGTGGKLAPVPVSLATSLAAAPLTVTEDGGLRESFASFVAEVAALPEQAETPVAAELAFGLAKAEAKVLPRDFGPIEVRFDHGEGGSVTASPKLDGDLGVYPFAAAFEDSWQGYDGGEGRLALLVERSEPAVFWYARTGTGSGISLANPQSPEFAYHAVPPLAAVPLEGIVESAGGGVDRVVAVDLDSWWRLFAETFERLAAAAAGEVCARLDGIRRELAGALADRLEPLAPAPAGDGFESVRAVFEAVVENDLRSRPTIVGAAVEVGRGETPSGGPATILSGHASTPIGTAAVATSPTAVRLEAGVQRLAYAAPPAPAGQARQNFSVRFEGDRLEREGVPPLDLILHDSTGADHLAVDFGLQSAPVPLIGLPAAPVFRGVGAEGSQDSDTLGEALAWTVAIELSAGAAEQDRLAVAIAFDTEAEPASPSSPADSQSLFGALGRAARFSAALPEEPGAESVALFAELAEAVAKALPRWRAPAPEVPGLPGGWRYEFDLGDLSMLVVTREASDSASPPPWPALAGYQRLEGAGETARYRPEADGEAGSGLRISVPGLRLLMDRAVRVHGRFIRNEGLAGPAFVYHSAIASSQAVSPCLQWEAPRAEPPVADLESALGALLAIIDEDPKRPYALGLDAALVRRLEADGEAPLETRVPLALIPPVTIGGAQSVIVADLAREFATTLATARAGIEPDAGGEEVALILTLLDEASAPVPLARLGVRIPVPGDKAWWGPARD